MDISRLPPGLRAQLAAATRAQGVALASPAITGPQALAAVAGVSAGLVSKWGSLDHAEAPTIEAVAVIEAASGVPHYAAALAALTGHRLAPIADETAPPVAIDAHRFAAQALAAAARLHEALADGVVDRAEARAGLDDLGRLAGTISDLMIELSRLAEG